MAAPLSLDLAPGEVAASIGTSGTVFAVSEVPTADPAGDVAGLADATVRVPALVCTVNPGLALSPQLPRFHLPAGGKREVLLRNFSAMHDMMVQTAPVQRCRHSAVRRTGRGAAKAQRRRAQREGAGVGLRGLRPDLRRSERSRGFLVYGSSEDGGLDDVDEFLPRRRQLRQPRLRRLKLRIPGSQLRHRHL